jgi:hypothetical protein
MPSRVDQRVGDAGERTQPYHGREMACKVIDSKTLANHWVNRFIRRNPGVSSCTGIPLRSARAVNLTHEFVAAHFQRVQSQIRKFNILTEDIWNMDETGLAMGLCANGYVVSGKGKRRVHVKAPQNREWVSIIQGISASGRFIRLW